MELPGQILSSNAKKNLKLLRKKFLYFRKWNCFASKKKKKKKNLNFQDPQKTFKNFSILTLDKTPLVETRCLQPLLFSGFSSVQNTCSKMLPKNDILENCFL